MTRELRLLWPSAPSVVADPTDADVRSALMQMPPRGQFIVDRPDEPDRAEHYLQVERSQPDADHWRIEIRHGDEDHHLVTGVVDLADASMIISRWLTDEQSTPAAPRWWRYLGGDAFADRSYQLTAYIAGPDAPALWHRDRWLVLAPLLAPLLDTGRGRTSVRSLQIEPATDGGRAGLTRFGALTWSRVSEQKWTHDTQTGRSFRDVEILAPSWRASYRQGIAPDVLFRVTAGMADYSDRFSVLVATATDMRHEGDEQLHRTLTLLLQPTLVATKHRPFGLSVGGGRAYMQPLDEYDPIGSVTATSPTELREDQPIRHARALEQWRELR